MKNETAKVPTIVKSGSVSVKIYEINNGDYQQFEIAYYNSEGKRKKERRADKADAMARAKEIADDLARNYGANLTITATEAVSYNRATELLAGIPKPLEMIAGEYAEVFRLLRPGVSLVDCVNEYNKRNVVTVEAKTMADLLPAFIESKRAENKSGKYLTDLQDRLHRLSAFFQCPIHRITTADINNCLQTMKDKKTGKVLSPGSKVTYRLRLSAFFNSSVARQHLPKDWEVNFSGTTNGVMRPRVDKKRVRVYSVEEMTRLLCVAAGYVSAPTKEAMEKTPALKELSEKQKKSLDASKARLRDLVPYLALGAFGSTRNSTDGGEIAELDWRDIDFAGNQICVDNGSGKVSDRYIPMTENLKAWLLPFAKTSGPIVPVGVRKRRALLCKLAGVAWIDNGLRKSCISYKLALSGNVEQTAADAGNSPQMIYSRYRMKFPKEQGERWFNIMPPVENNVVPMVKVA